MSPVASVPFAGSSPCQLHEFGATPPLDRLRLHSAVERHSRRVIGKAAIDCKQGKVIVLAAGVNGH